MKNVLASLIAVGLIGGSQVLAEPSEARTGDQRTHSSRVVADEMKRVTPEESDAGEGREYKRRYHMAEDREA